MILQMLACENNGGVVNCELKLIQFIWFSWFTGMKYSGAVIRNKQNDTKMCVADGSGFH